MTEPINDTTRVRTAFAVIINPDAKRFRQDSFMLGLAEENRPGYYPEPQYGVFATYEAASAKAQELNGLLFKLSPEDAAMIVASSMFHGKRRTS